MKAANTYLTFDGDCKDAMTFYGKCLGAEPNLTSFSAGPPEMAAMVKDLPDRILHAEVASGAVVLMASDSMPGSPFVKGTNFSISLSCESQAEMERIFTALSEGGQVTMPMDDVFWGGRFGMLTDRFGISWMSKLGRWIAGCLICLCCAVAIASKQGTVRAEQLRVSGLREPVEVIRDHWGVPHIYAKNSDDLFFAQGYITAQDRLFQLDLWRRIGTGKLAEV